MYLVQHPFCVERKSQTYLVLPHHFFKDNFPSISPFRQYPRLACNSNILGRKWYESAILRGETFFSSLNFLLLNHFTKVFLSNLFFPVNNLNSYE